MHALEMEPEEIESLVGSGSRRKAQLKKEDDVLSLVLKPGFLSKVAAVAALAMVAIFYLAAKGGEKAFDDLAEDTQRKESVTNASETAHNTSRQMAFEDGSYMYSKFSTIPPLVDHPFPDDQTKQKVAEDYGHWHFWDGDEDVRPTNDYLAEYPNRDIPGDDFPDDAWQGDAVFVNHYLNDADQLVSRAMEAIFTEYGHGKPLPAEGLADRMKMFHWEKVNLATATAPPEKYAKRGDRGNGGWTTARSFDGLVLRLTHAMMTSDTFTVVMGGHSAAAGQGNHFRQSYMMQFHKIMYPIFARLGVKLITRNVGQGGLGTIQGAMGSGSVYGDEVDLLLWDSGMTEGGNPEHIDLFLRQGLLGGNRVPVIWGGTFALLQMLHENADVDVGEWGNARDGIPEVESADHAQTIPYAARFMKCKPEAQSLCQDEPRFCSKCWIEREDGITPTAPQLGNPRGQVKWHPGWRDHQLVGRNLAMGVLTALQAAINTWNEGVMGGPPLDDDFWHVTDYYENIREKVQALDPALGSCYANEGVLPTRMCNTPMKARTQYTPRANFEETSLTSIIKPTADGYVPKNELTPLYEGADAHNTCFDLPEGAVDVFNIVVGRRQLQEQDVVGSAKVPELARQTPPTRSLSDEIVPGKGWEVWGEPQGYCDGTYNAICARSGDNECVLYGHHDERGAIIGNEYSGWLVLTLDDVKEGLIVLKLHTWHIESESTKTEGWTSVNDEAANRRLREGRRSFQEDVAGGDAPFDDGEHDERMLMRSYDTPELPEGFMFEYAIDGQITTLTKEQFLEQKKQVQRVVETLTILDDPNFTSTSKNVEIAIRLRGGGRSITFGLSHIYWA